MKKYLIEIREYSKFLTIDNIKIRTPTSFIVPEEKLKETKTILHQHSITNYIVKDYNEQFSNDNKTVVNTLEVLKDQPIGEEPTNILEEFMSNIEREKLK